MFDVGFSELVLIVVVGLLVFGPDKLPQAARSAGLWIGRIKRVYQQTRREVERELGMDDIKRQLHNEEILQSLGESPAQIRQALEQTADELNQVGEQWQAPLKPPEVSPVREMDKHE